MLTIKRVAEVVGVPEATLRAWERRYGVVQPVRTEAGYRLYDEAAVRVLEQMRALLDAGWSARQAAEAVRERRAADHRRDRGAGELVAVVPGDVDVLARAAAVFDAVAVERALDDAFSWAGFEQVVDLFLLPALAELGLAWHAGRVSVAGEHLVSATVLRRLSAAFEAAGRAEGAPGVLVGLPPGCRHELGLLAFATSARRQGLDVVYLGSDVPLDTWAAVVGGHGPEAVVLGVPTRADVAPTRAVVDAVAAAHPEVRLFVGGAHQARVGGVAEALGHQVTAAARDLAMRLRGIDTSGAPAAADPVDAVS